MNKVDEPFNFILHKVYDVSPISEYVSMYDKEWTLNTMRQNTTIHHTKTFTYFINMFPIDWKPGNPYTPSFECKDETLWSMIKPIIKDMEINVDGSVGRVLLIKLGSNKNITPHKDKGNYLLNARRFHLPIITNPNVNFYVDGELKNLKVGECWEINNAKEHMVINEGQTDRVHLLFDIIPGKFLP